MNLLVHIWEILNKSATAINSIAVAFLLFRYIQDSRKARLERIKLRQEIEAGREHFIVPPTDEDLKNYGIRDFSRQAKAIDETVSRFSEIQERTLKEIRMMIDGILYNTSESARGRFHSDVEIICDRIETHFKRIEELLKNRNERTSGTDDE